MLDQAHIEDLNSVLQQQKAQLLPRWKDNLEVFQFLLEFQQSLFHHGYRHS